MLSMADGTTRTKEAIRLPPGLSLDLATDGGKLRWIRSAPQISLEGVLEMAHRIHDVGLRDAAIGHILKNRMREVLKAPALQASMTPEKARLYTIADMMSDEEKRVLMFARIDAFDKARRND